MLLRDAFMCKQHFSAIDQDGAVLTTLERQCFPVKVGNCHQTPKGLKFIDGQFVDINLSGNCIITFVSCKTNIRQTCLTPTDTLETPGPQSTEGWVPKQVQHSPAFFVDAASTNPQGLTR